MQADSVKLEIYNLLGQLVNAYDLGLLLPGAYDLHFDAYDYKGESLTSGIYFYRLSAGDQIATRKMVLLK